MKLRVRILDQRIRQIAVELCDIQFGFRKVVSTTEPICALRTLLYDGPIFLVYTHAVTQHHHLVHL